MIITRFAPSPTGSLHLGSLRAILLPYCTAKKNNGKFILRIDDTDTARSDNKYVEEIKESLEYLHVDYDIYFKQSERISRYDEVFSKLIEQEYVYACYETKTDLDWYKKSGKTIFDKSSRFKNTGELYWRFELKQVSYHLNDLILGNLSFNKEWSDPILKKPDGSYSYIFTSVVDDIDYNVTHIIRGSEHTNNAVIQQEIGNAILKNWQVEWAHFSLLKETDGRKMSKRTNDSIYVKDISKKYEYQTFYSIFTSLGTSKSQLISANQESYIHYCDLHSFSKSSQVFDIQILDKTNAKILAITNENDKYWNLLRNNITFRSEFDIKKNQILSILNVENKYHYLLNIDNIINYINEKTNKREYCQAFYMYIFQTNTGPVIADIINAIKI